RRHTMSKRDWSSDECSSDLSLVLTPAQEKRRSRLVSLGMRKIHNNLVNAHLKKEFMRNRSFSRPDQEEQGAFETCQQPHIQKKCLMRHLLFMKKSARKWL